MTSPYQPPKTSHPAAGDIENSPVERKRRFWKRVLNWSIPGIVLPILLGVTLTVFGMLRSFSELSTTEGADPDALAEGVSLAMKGTMVGLSIAALATICLVVAVFRLTALPKSRQP